MEKARALLDPASRRIERVGVEDGLAVPIALHQPHGVAETEGAMNRLDQKAMLRPSMMRRAHP